ncbi:MAG: hypothetical protein FJ279_09380 [Planctomycetes bacterium]|nr:hypothetical protein [Planctomycetota bacterium]MBM4078326.1 hypothetical protein [Planctomycetota bacterium]
MKMLDPTNKRFISGIYNYCDRWCERCAKTERCYLYAQEQADRAEYEAQGKDPDSDEAAMEMVHQNFQRTLEMLKQMAQEQGLDLDKLAEEAPVERVDPRGQPLCRRADGYRKKASQFLKRLRKTLKTERAGILKRAGVVPSAERDAKTLAEIMDAYEVIAWYHMQIAVKLNRAMSSKQRSEPKEDPEMREITLSDGNGSAKVAYLGLSNSMVALQKVYAWDEDLRDEALALLVEAEKLRKSIDAEFPGHRTFKRPGFDD